MLKQRTLGWLGLTVLNGICAALLCVSCGGGKPSTARDAAPDASDTPSDDAQNVDPGDPADAAMTSDAADPLGDAGDLPPPPQYEGVPFDVIMAMPPKGCVSKAPAGDTLTLQLDSTVKAVRLGSQDGQLVANGSFCDAGSAHTIKITGGSGDETVIIDGSLGDFPAAFLGASPSIVIDMAAGKDTVAMMGSLDNDSILLGTLDGKTVLTSGNKFPRLSIANNETLIVSAGPGDDRIEASGGMSLGAALAVPLKAWGGEGSDVMSGGAKDDELHAGLGDDSFETAAKPDGADLYDGGPDIDSMSYALRMAAVVVKLNNAADDGEASEKDNVQSTVENLTGGNGSDNLTGSASDNAFIGGPGNDTLNGGAGDDLFLEAAASAGSDIMNGGDGSDTVDYSGRHADLNVTLCTSTASGCMTGACSCAADDGEASEKDTLVNLENVFAGSGNDTLIGNVASNYFTGGLGNDTLRGGDGDDNLYGEAGNDVLEGGDGDDLLDGAEGLDTFDGGPGDGDICVMQSKETQKGCELH